MITKQSDQAALVERDLDVLWHPCTQMKDHEHLPMIPIARGEGAYLYDVAGKSYLDAISSWWVNIFGHANPTIAAAIAKQASTLEQIIFAGFTHEPAVSLAERLIALTPPGLAKVFLTDSGSSAVEVALKMSFHYWRNKQQTQRTRFITLANSYHGETLGALAVGDVPLYRETYAPLLMESITVPSPGVVPVGSDLKAHQQHCLEVLAAKLAEQGDRVAAMIVEPLVQCAGYMRMYDASYLHEALDLCRQFDVHFIADEIAVGFGRTGTLFACEQAGITPDFMCIGKGLTGGFLPLSATLTNAQVYDAFYDDYETLRAFLHSHSYCGNPLACAAAHATLDLFEAQPVIARNQVLGQRLDQALAPLAASPNVANVRRTGMIAAFDIVDANGEPYPWQQRHGIKLYQFALEHNVLLRPLGDSVYFMPPYIVTAEEIDAMVGVAAEGVRHAVAGG